MRVAPATADRRTDDHAARNETEPPSRVILPAGRIELVPFALAEVEQQAEDDRVNLFL
jgi:hypothetical protein